MAEAPSDSRNPLEAHVPAALAARGRAYAPYSKFQVGAALVGRSGRVYSGCNVENATYGLSVCAERTAVVRAIAEGEKEFIGIVVATSSSPPSPPCGLCRQTLTEFADDLPVLLVNDKGERTSITLRELFPYTFTKSFLDR